MHMEVEALNKTRQIARQISADEVASMAGGAEAFG
jgi:hypothetical protein